MIKSVVISVSGDNEEEIYEKISEIECCFDCLDFSFNVEIREND